MQLDNCPICLDRYSTTPNIEPRSGGCKVSCETCGTFGLSEEAWDDFLDPQNGHGSLLTAVQRSRMSHRIRNAHSSEQLRFPKVDSDFLQRFKKDGFPGPNPAQQVVNLIRYIGDETSKSGGAIETAQSCLFAIVGSPNPEFARNLILELNQAGLLVCENVPDDVSTYPVDLNLTLAGWEKYESEKHGKFSGKTGFIAMQFGDAILDPFLQDTIKPTIKSEIGYDLFDLREVARAGVIDDIMRAQIRDSAFVLVDLTHDNSGAYWEAGYAEGLGKPVVYLCEKSKFDEKKTHFDTNHCTTVIWETGNIEKFKVELIATLRRSLNLFS